MYKYLFAITLFVLFGFTSLNNDNVTQISTIDALLSGIYDGEVSLEELTGYGNFGIGTFDKLDGEMIVLDSKIYQVKSDGEVYQPEINIKTPFATVSKFKPEKSLQIKENTSFDELKSLLDSFADNQNLFCGIKITGRFQTMKTRSVPKQKNPYPELKEIAKTQPEFEFANIEGTIVGYRCPLFVKGINVPGYHLHFISSDFKSGGHILDLEIENALCEIDYYHNFSMILPKNNSDFSKTNFSKDRQKELEEIEK